MDTLGQLFGYFFTHKDFLPPAHELDGTLFTPLHLAVSAILLALIIFAAIRLRHLGERGLRTCLFVLWVSVAVLEVIKTLWETFAGATVHFEIWGNLPLYPCSIFMYAMPLAIFGKGIVRKMGCGYVCTLGTLGAAVNFFYPVNVIGRYSCISFAGCRHSFSTARCFSARSLCSSRATILIGMRAVRSIFLCLLCRRWLYRSLPTRSTLRWIPTICSSACAPSSLPPWARRYPLSCRCFLSIFCISSFTPRPIFRSTLRTDGAQRRANERLPCAFAAGG